jgi:hypothetical protein
MNHIRLILMCLVGFFFLGPGSAAACPFTYDDTAPIQEAAAVVVDTGPSSMSAIDCATQPRICLSVRRSTRSLVAAGQDLEPCGTTRSSIWGVTAESRTTSDPLCTTLAELPFSITANQAAVAAELASLQH